MCILLSGKLSAQSVGLNLSSSMHGIADSYSSLYSRSPYQFILGTGVSYVHPVRGRLFIKTGISFLHTQLSLEGAPDIRVVIDSTGNTVDIVRLGEKDLKDKKSFLMVPILANYYLLNSPNTNLYVSAGVKFRWLYHTRIWQNSTYDGEKVTNLKGKENKNHFVNALSVGFGLRQPIGNRLVLFVTPSMDFYSYSNEGAALENKNFELNVDLHYHF